MADLEPIGESGDVSRVRVTAALLNVGAYCLSGATLLWALYQFWQIGQSDELGAGAFLATLAIMVAGLVGSAFLWGVEELLRRTDGLERAIQDSAAYGRDALANTRRAVDATGGGIPGHTVDELVVLLREVRDISLLSEPQRQLRLTAQGRAAIELLQHEVPLLLREHNWIEARRRVQEVRERFPSFAECDALEQQIERMREQVESQDVEVAERQIDDLKALGAWERVGEVCNDLLHRHPQSQRVLGLVQKVRAQKSTMDAQARARLMAEAQDASNKREWRTALGVANQLIQRFPRTPEAQALLLQLPILRENAEIQERQRVEHEFRDALKDHRYQDALRAARELIDQYPNSPQAEFLRQQIPKLEERLQTVARV